MSSAWQHFLKRWRQLLLENLGDIVAFVRPLTRSLLLALDQLGSSEWRRAAKRFGVQALKGVARGSLPVAVFASALWLAATQIAAGTGALGRDVIESYVLLILVRDALPLGVAMFLAVRQGAALTTKYAFPATAGPDVNTADDRLELLMPGIAAAALAGAVFFMALAWALLAGYLQDGPVALGDIGTIDALMSTTLRTGYLAGIGKAAVFGAVVAYVASALGWATGQSGPAVLAERGHYPHYRVWEASSWSLTLCTVLTVVIAPVLNRAAP